MTGKRVSGAFLGQINPLLDLLAERLRRIDALPASSIGEELDQQEIKRARLDACLVAFATLVDHLDVDAHWSKDLETLALSLRSVNSWTKEPPLFRASNRGKKDHHVLTLARCFISLAFEARLLSGMRKSEASQNIASNSALLTKAVQGARSKRLDAKTITTIHKTFRYDRDSPNFDPTAKDVYERHVAIMNIFVEARGQAALADVAAYCLREAERYLAEVDRDAGG